MQWQWQWQWLCGSVTLLTCVFCARQVVLCFYGKSTLGRNMSKRTNRSDVSEMYTMCWNSHPTCCRLQWVAMPSAHEHWQAIPFILRALRFHRFLFALYFSWFSSRCGACSVIFTMTRRLMSPNTTPFLLTRSPITHSFTSLALRSLLCLLLSVDWWTGSKCKKWKRRCSFDGNGKSAINVNWHI